VPGAGGAAGRDPGAGGGLAGTLAREGSCAVINGEAGIGKSRLIRELPQMAASRRVPVVAGRAVPASELARRQRGRAGIVHLPLGRLSEREVVQMIAACSPGAGDQEQSG
jgi:predicted ATP-dependent serine protease